MSKSSPRFPGASKRGSVKSTKVVSKYSQKKPDLDIKKQYPGLITGGTKAGLKKHGYKLANSKNKSGGGVLSGTDPKGKTAVFVDKSVKSYRAVAKKAGMNVKGKDVDHVQAKNTIRSKDKVYSRLQAIKPSPNRSAGKIEKSAVAKLKDGVTTASRSTIRKINGHKQEKPMTTKPKRGDLSERFGGYAKNAAKNLERNSQPKTSTKRTRASKKMLSK